MEEQFEIAIKAINDLSTKPSNDNLLKIYAFFKQSREGDVSFARPSILNQKGRAKWDSWKKLEKMDKQDAMANYIALAYSLTGNDELKL